MKVLIFSQDKEVKKFAKSAGSDVTYYSNFMALKDFVLNMDSNLGAEARIALIFDYDNEEHREMIDEYNELVADNSRVFRIYISGNVALKELREHQSLEHAAQAYLFKPLDLEAINETLEDLEQSTPYVAPQEEEEDEFDEDDVTKMDVSFRKMVLDKDFASKDVDKEQDDEDSTEVRSLVDSHNEDSEALDSQANQKIQDSFDAVFNEDEEEGDDMSLSFGLEEEEQQGPELEFTQQAVTGVGHGEVDLALSDGDDHEEHEERLESIDAIDEASGELTLSTVADPPQDTELEHEGTEQLVMDQTQQLGQEQGDETAVRPDPQEVVEEDVSEALVAESTDKTITSDKGHHAETSEYDEGSLQFHDKTGEAKSMSSLTFDIEEATQETISHAGLDHDDMTTTHVQEEGETTAQRVPEKESVLNFLAPKSELLDTDDFKPSLNESDALRYQATIRQLREEREELLTTINKQKQDAALFEHDNLGLKAELDEAKIELTIMKKRFHGEIEDLKYRLGLAEEKKLMAEERASHLENEFARLENKVRINIGQVQQREKELEGQLELVKIDSESQVNTRDKKILELKRKIDQLEFNMQNTMIREQKSRQDKVILEDRLDKIMRTLRGSIEVLEEDMSWKSRASRDHYDKGDQ